MAALGNSFPEVDLQIERTIVKLLQFLKTRIQKRDLLQVDVTEKQNHFRNILVKLEYENASLRHNNNEQKKIISILEDRICKLQNHIDGLLCKLNNAYDAMRNIQQELRDRDRQLQQHTLEKQKIIQKYNIMIQAETDRMTEEMQTKLQEQCKRLTSCIKKKDDKLKLVREILTSVYENTVDNIVLTPPISSNSKIETAEKVTIISEKELPLMTPINLQTSKNPRGQIRQTLSSPARTVSNMIHGVTEEPNPSLSKEKSSTVIVDSHISNSRNQISSYTRTDSDNVQKKATKGTVLMTVAESSMPSDSKIKIVEKSNSMTSVDSRSSSTIASTDITIITKINCNRKDKIPVVKSHYQNVDRWIDHRPAGIVPIGTILQPQTQLHKRIRKLTNPKDL